MYGENCKVQIVSKQNPNPNGVAATEYKEGRVVQDPLDAPLVGSTTIHGPKARYGGATLKTDSGRQLPRIIPDDSGRI